MIERVLIALFVVAALCGAARALPGHAPAAPGLGPVRVQAGGAPDVVRLLVQRARRAERRGDMATAEALYEVIRELGYVVRRRPAAQPGSRSGGGNGQVEDRGGNTGARGGDGGGGARGGDGGGGARGGGGGGDDRDDDRGGDDDDDDEDDDGDDDDDD